MKLTFFLLIIAGSLPYILNAEPQKKLTPSEEYIINLKELAKAGDANAQLQLGHCYFYGKNCPKNLLLASMWFRKSAEQGNSGGQYNLANCYEHGFGVGKNLYESYLLYKKAATQNLKEARYKLATVYLNGIAPEKELKTPEVKQDIVKAETILKKLVADNYTPSYTLLVSMYIGKKISETQKKYYLELLIEAAKTGDAKAYLMLADCYYAGWGVKKDLHKTLQLLKRAADNGSLEGVAKLAYCYEYGDGVKPNPEKAFKLFEFAAERGHPLAQVKVGDYYSSGTFVKQDIQKAISWYKKAAVQESPQALFQLGVFAADGIGEAKNRAKATELFLKSAIMGYPRAQYNLACYLLEDKRSKPKAAFFWFKRAAVQNDPKAQKQLAFCFLQGIGVKKDTKKALKWLYLAAKNGDEEAKQLITQMETR
jgi:TPR repeat protein